MICLSTGLPHPAALCDRCARFERRLEKVRRHPDLAAARALLDAARAAYDRSRGLPWRERDVLEKAWRAADDAERLTFARLLREATDE